MSKNLAQVYAANPITTIGATDVMYVVTTDTTDAAINGANFLAQVAPLSTKGDLYTFSTVNARLAVGITDGMFLQVHSAAATGLAWSTVTLPSTTTINQILYSSSANVVGGISAVNSAVLISSAGGVPSFSTTLPAGLTIPGYQATITPAALTKTDDTNVTLTLGGTPATALLQAASITAGWTGTLSGTRGGTGANNGASIITLGGSLTTSGAFASTFTMTNTTSVTFPTSGTLATTSQIPSLPLSLANGGTGGSLIASNGGIFYSTASAGAILSGTATAGQLLTSGASTAPAWTTSTYPLTNAASTLLYASSANVMAALATANSSILVTNSSGIPAWGTTLPAFTTSAITFSPTTGGIVGTTTNDNAASGKVGEFFTNAVLQASAITLVNNTATDVTNINLTAGDWDVWGSANAVTVGTGWQAMFAWISSAATTVPDYSILGGINLLTGTINGGTGAIAPMQRFSLSSPTTVYLEALGAGTSGNGTVCGSIYARRVR